MKKCRKEKIYPNFINKSFKLSLKNFRTYQAAEKFKLYLLKSEIEHGYVKINSINKSLYNLYRKITSEIKNNNYEDVIWNNYLNMVDEKCDEIKKQKKTILKKKFMNLVPRHNTTVLEPEVVNDMNIVVNWSKEVFTEEQMSLLNMGLKHRILQNNSNMSDIVINLETEMKRIDVPEGEKVLIREKVSKVIKKTKKYHVDTSIEVAKFGVLQRIFLEK